MIAPRSNWIGHTSGIYSYFGSLIVVNVALFVAFIPGFVNDGSYLELDPIKDAYLSTTIEIAFTPSEETGE